MKFFRPAGDSGANGKKAERLPLSPLCNANASADGSAKPAGKANDDADSDVVLVDDDAGAGCKRKRPDGGSHVGQSAAHGQGAAAAVREKTDMASAPKLTGTEDVESLRKEQAELEAALEEEVLLDSGLVSSAAGGRLTLMPNPSQLAVWLEGRTETLSELVTALAPLLPVSPASEVSALRTLVVDLAQRKSYGAKDAVLDGVAASDDASPGRLWFWEVRELKKHVPDKAARKLAELQRKRRKELRERLCGVIAAADALAAHAAVLDAAAGGGKAPTAAQRRSSESKAAKAWNRLSKLPERDAIEDAFRLATGGVAAGGASEARRERARKEKEDKARQKEEEAQAKEAKRAAEGEAKRAAKEAAAAAKAGFQSKQGLRKSQNIMESFFKRPTQPKPGAGAAAAPSGGAGSTAAGDTSAAAGGATPLRPELSLPGTSQQGPASSHPAGTPLGREGTAKMYDFSKRPVRMPDASVVAAMDAAAARLPLSAEELAADFRDNHERWKKQRAERRRMIGVPPTWARRPGAPMDLRQLASAYYGDVGSLGTGLEGLRTWRRKLIAFPKKETARPPYYGSFSRTSTAVTGRRPLGRDSSLDYEVASDEEWEEEPEGESLSDSGDEADSQMGGAAGEGGEEEDDGFIVGDDHLSDDEGVHLSQDPDDPMDVDAGPGRAVRTLAPRHVDPRLQQLEAAIDRVRTNNRPILLVRALGAAANAAATPGRAPAATPGAAVVREAVQAPVTAGVVGPCALRAEPRTGLNTGLDPGLLGALRPILHHPDVALTPPLELDVFSAAAAGTWGPALGVSCYVAEDGSSGAAALLAGTAAAGPGGLHLAAMAGVSGAGPASARAPGSGARVGRPPSALSDAQLAAFAEYIAACSERSMDKVVEGYLSSLPTPGPGVPKPPAKLKLREAVKRLGAWSAAHKRWLLHGDSVEAAVARAKMAAAAAAAAGLVTAHEGTPLAGAGPGVIAAHAVLGNGPSAMKPVALAARAAWQGGGTPLALATPSGPATGAEAPAPTPTPMLVLGPPPTPSTAPGVRPFLAAPACTPVDAALASQPRLPLEGPRPADRMVPPQQLANALTRLAAEAPRPSPAPLAMPAAGSAGPDETITAGPAYVAAGAQSDAMECDGPAAQEPERHGRSASAAPSGPSSANEGAAVSVPEGAALPDAAVAGASLAQAPRSEQGEGRAAPQPSAEGAATVQTSVEAVIGGPGLSEDAGGSGVQGASPSVEERTAEDGAPLPRPMPPALPSLQELAVYGTGHPYWPALTAWILGGGSAAAVGHKNGPSWADVGSALCVFEPGELESRVHYVPLDVVRALLALCQHRKSSHLRSGAFKAMANLAVVLAATATAPLGTASVDGTAAALVGVGTPAMDPAAPFAARPGQDEQPQRFCPELAAAAASFRHKVASDVRLHAVVRGAATSLPGASANNPRCIFSAHMLLALQRLLRDPAAALLVTRTQARVQKEQEAVRAGGAQPPPPSAVLEAKWAARLLTILVDKGRQLEHPGCRKGVAQCAVALLEHPRLADELPQALQGGAGQDPPVENGGQVVGSGQPRGKAVSWAAGLNGNDPRAFLPAACLTLLSGELRFISARSDEGEDDAGHCGRGAARGLTKCERARVLLALHAAERTLRFLGSGSSSAHQLLRHGDTQSAVSDVVLALGDASSALAATEDSLLQSLCSTVGELADALP
ncbi:hypothetical protein GPECTOR_7g1114 [Gonium pectorale]|uniref:Chromatin assembly factor 1 subunit A dimerization domain-containing protein n=1 Tax=Gonium pectorale TaxID=33097 RepID=A0A150GTS0_GONPE|nr:hypothetical protein GPECTOR_7g1114 [Gonium pectorale]|eukprot:KXZ53221.1 hypothetical protein GPECTOR_7g1114 [Gonium pectorale]